MICKLLIFIIICECASAHHLRHHGGDTKSLQEKEHLPYGHKKLDKMMNKAILQIILGDLHPSDVLLLKALNYTLEEVTAIRERELNKIKDEQELGSSKYQVHHRSFQRDASLDTYNKQAVYDYENAQTEEGKPATENNLRQSFDRAMEPHVVFKIRYDDSEFDSASDERAKAILKNHRTKTIYVPNRENIVNSATSQSFQVDDFSSGASPNAAALEATTSSANLEEFNKQAMADYENLVPNGEQPDKREFTNQEDFDRSMNDTSRSSSSSSTTMRSGSEYEGLEWIGDDVYRVVPEAMEALLNYEDPEQMSSIETFNDTLEYQNDADAADGNYTANGNLTSYQRLALAQRKDQGQRAIEDIKMRVLAMTGRFNHTSTNNQVQREKLTMFSPTCQTPRNTDAEAWSDPYLMNMHFHLNLTSGEHVLAAKLRLYKLPQESLVSSSTSRSSSISSGNIYEEDEEDEKKIRVSVYFYTKSLKKHRVKKRLMDSIVTPLTAQGSHLALDVRQALRYWRPNAQQHNNSNHGLVVQVEDQDGRALKPSLYIQEPNCQTAPGQNPDEKAYQFVPALFIRACTRYVRFVNGKMEMYVQCQQRH